jgi:hypothetical protein
MLRTNLLERAPVVTPAPGHRAWPWVMIFGRTALFVLLQALFAVALSYGGAASAWEGAAAWWPIGVVFANIICLLALTALLYSDGRRFRDLFRIERAHVKSDLLALLIVLLIAGPVSYLPNVLLARWLFGDPQAVLALLVRPLPLWAVVASLALFPLTQGLVELPVYFGYAMPRLEAQGLRRWQAVAVPALLLGLQHAALPLLFDLRFVAWRGLMFIPFALLTGLVLQWRPRLLPYLAAVQALMDLSFAAMFLGAV